MSNSFDLKNIHIIQALSLEPLRKAPLMFDAETHPEEKPYVELWRMQNEKGEGPYTANRDAWWDEPHDRTNGRPGPFGDPGFTEEDRKNIPQKLYGFESIDHLNNWFSPTEQERLATHGYRPTKVKAKKVWTSGKQAIYEPYEEPKEEKLAASEKDLQDLEKGARGDWQKEGYKITHKEYPERGYTSIVARDKNNTIVGNLATSYIDPNKSHMPVYSLDEGPSQIPIASVPPEHRGKMFPQHLEVLPAHQRKGLANAMYQYSEKLTGKTMAPGNIFGNVGISSKNTTMANAFRQANVEVPSLRMKYIQTPDSKALWAQPNRPFGKAELEKGVMRRIAPFNPSKDVQPEDKEAVHAWQTYGQDDFTGDYNEPNPAIIREGLSEMHPAAKKRALHRLHGKTPARRNPRTGEREFLLHRGVSAEEAAGSIKDNEVQHRDRSSWTIRPQIAVDFARDPYFSNSMERPEEPDEALNPGGIISAWIPESKIVHVPRQYGNVRGIGENDYALEHEIIVDPHQSQLHKFHPHDQIPKSGELNEKLAASEDNDIQQPIQPQPTQDWRSSYMQHMKHNPNPIPETRDILDAVKLKMLNQGKLFYDPKVGFKLNRRITDKGNKSEPLMRNEPGTVKLVHYSNTPGLKSINPNFQGTGTKDEMIKRSGKTSVPVSYYYRAGTEEEPMVTQNAKSRYHSTLGPQHKLYDLSNDHQKLIHQAISDNGGAWNTENILGKIKDAGYHGFFNSGSSLPNVVALFHSHPVDKEEVL